MFDQDYETEIGLSVAPVCLRPSRVRAMREQCAGDANGLSFIFILSTVKPLKQWLNLANNVYYFRAINSFAQ